MILQRIRHALVTAASVVAVAGVVVAAWSIAVTQWQLPKILLPSPLQVWRAAALERDALITGGLTTLATAVISLGVAVLIGGGIAIVFSQSAAIRRAFFPYVIFLQTVPIVAIAPLLIIWSGYTFRTAVIATVVICIFPIISNLTNGLLAMRRDHQELFSLYGTGRWGRMCYLQLPGAVGSLIAGMQVSSGLAVIGAIIAEFFVSNGSTYNGLGALMTGWQGQSRTDALIAALLVSALLGLGLFAIVRLLAVTVLRRWTGSF